MHKEMVDGFVKCFDMGEIQTQKTDGMIWVLFKCLYKNLIHNLNNFYTFIFCKKFKGLMLLKHENSHLNSIEFP